MPIKSFIKNKCIDHLNNKFDTNSLKMLFIISHMRSGSSLLVHILNSNPAIIGYGETHQKYHLKNDFGTTAFNIYRAFNTLPGKETYVLDKLLYSDLISNIDLLKSAKTIFLLRNPVQALPSIHNMESDKYSLEKACEYYCERVRYIKDMANKLNSEKWTYTTYEELTEQSDKAFQRIKDFLELRQPLSTTYNTIWSTGKPGIGDPSEKIHAGKIIASKKGPDYPEELKPFLEMAQKEYQECREKLTRIIHQVPGVRDG